MTDTTGSDLRLYENSDTSVASVASVGSPLHESDPNGVKPHALYRFYSATGELLYVGITSSPSHRFAQHEDDKPWWYEVRGITLEPYPDRGSVLAAEARAIRVESPRHNIRRPSLKHVVAPGRGPATHADRIWEIGQILDTLGVPSPATVREAGAALREAGYRFRQDAVSAAVKIRKLRLPDPPTTQAVADANGGLCAGCFRDTGQEPT